MCKRIRRHSCVFRSKVTTHFGPKFPLISEQSYHLFRSKVSTFGADAETGGKKLPEWQRRWITQPGYLREKEVPVGSKEVIHAQDDQDPAPQA